MNVFSVHYADYMSMTPYSLEKVYGYHPHQTSTYYERLGIGWNSPLNSGDKLKEIIHRETNKFTLTLKPLMQKSEYYCFIVTNAQLPMFEEDIAKANIAKDIVYRSSQAAVNANYPEEGPKLHVFLIHYQGD